MAVCYNNYVFGACCGGESRLTEKWLCYIINASILGHFADRSGLLAIALFLTADIFDERIAGVKI